MSKVKIELNAEELRNILKSDSMKEILTSEAEQIRSRCGESYQIDTKYMGARLIASVYTTDREAIRENETNDTLIKALHK